MRILLLCCMFAGALLFGAGCVFEPYRGNHEFDLSVAKFATVSVKPICVLEFRNNSSAGIRMQQQLASGQVVADPYNRWVLPPGELVARALNSVFVWQGMADPVLVRGALDRFEVDENSGEFIVSGTFGSANLGTQKLSRFECRALLTEHSAAGISRAASLAVGKLADLIASSDFGEARP